MPKTAIKIQEKRINQRQTSNKSYQQLKEFQKYKKQLDNYCHELYQIISDCQKRNFIRNNLLEEITKISRKIQSQEFRIAVVGEFSQGKSTLINALLGEEIQPVREIPCSGVITVLKYGKEKRVICCYKDGTKEEISYSLYQEKASITEDIALGSLSEGLEKSNLKEIIFEHPNLDLCSSGVVIIDSPGLNEHPDRTSITEKLIEGTDAVIFLTNASRLLTQGERELIEDLKNKLTGKYNQPAENLFIVVNFCDLIRSEKGLQQVEERVKRFVLGEKPLITGNNRIHFLSSQLALDAILNQTENKYLIKFQDFTKSLEHFLIIERGSLEVKKIINKLNSLIQSIEAELKETEGILEGKVHLSESEKINILEQIGEISGVYYRIMETGEVLTKITIDEVTNSWNKWVENLDNRLIEKSQYWESDHSMFWDQEKVIKDYQDCFFRDLKEELSKWENQYFISILKKKLDFLDNYIRAEFQTIQENIEDINIKNHNISNKLSNQINTTISNIETEFVLGGIHIGAGAILGGILGLAFPLGWGILGSSAIGALLGWFGGEHDREKERNIKTKVFELGINRFTESLEQIFPEIDSKIESIFNERMELTRKAIDETIFIYESLLEKQDKFYQETLEQRQTEQHWINLKQQEIDQINTKIEKLFFSI